MKYQNVIEANFIKRPNRFIAHVAIDNQEEIVHVRNTGRCRELLLPNARVILEDCSNVPTRKTRYSLVSVFKDDMLVNMDSQIPNQVVFQALKENKIASLQDLTFLKREKTFGNSRFDMYFEKDNKRGFMEVKGVTLEEDGIAMFPDAPTERGTKHIYEMVEAVKQGYEGYIFFLIQMKGPKLFNPNWSMDKNFSEALSFAKENGVKILAYDSIVTKDSIDIGDPIDIEL